MKTKHLLTLLASLLLLGGCGGHEDISVSTVNSSSSSDSTSVSTNSSISSNTDSYYKELTITKQIQSLGKGLCPSKGNVKALVVPVNFSDIDKKLLKDDIKNYFEETSNKSNPTSLKYFYYQSSYNQLDLSFEYLDAYTPRNTSSYYGNKANFNGDDYNTNGSRALYKEILEAYNSNYNYSDYDSDNDGYIDAIYMIYNHSIDYTYSNMFWWAYTSWCTDTTPIDNVKLGRFIWMSDEFFQKDDVTNNTKTLIHETAHLFGIDDYYDYNTNKGATKGGLGGGDLMDNDKGSPCGEHNPYTKGLLGWIKPQVMDFNTPNEEHTLTLRPFESTGDTIILANEFDESNELYQEYFTLEYYTPTGLNEYDKPFSIPGIRMIHVSSQFDSKGKIKFNNTDTSYKLISQITTSSGATYINSSTLRNDSTLFTEGESLTSCQYNTGTELKYKFEVISLNENEASIKITRKF